MNKNIRAHIREWYVGLKYLNLPKILILFEVRSEVSPLWKVGARDVGAGKLLRAGLVLGEFTVSFHEYK
jgi:hypothetical protein